MLNKITNRFRDLLPPPIYESDDKKTRTASLLKSMILRMAVAIALFIAVSLLVNPSQFVQLLSPAVVFPLKTVSNPAFVTFPSASKAIMARVCFLLGAQTRANPDGV